MIRIDLQCDLSLFLSTSILDEILEIQLLSYSVWFSQEISLPLPIQHSNIFKCRGAACANRNTWPRCNCTLQQGPRDSLFRWLAIATQTLPWILTWDTELGHVKVQIWHIPVLDWSIMRATRNKSEVILKYVKPSSQWTASSTEIQQSNSSETFQWSLLRQPFMD